MPLGNEEGKENGEKVQIRSYEANVFGCFGADQYDGRVSFWLLIEPNACAMKNPLLTTG